VVQAAYKVEGTEPFTLVGELLPGHNWIITALHFPCPHVFLIIATALTMCFANDVSKL